MRPVKRASWPEDNNGERLNYAQYQSFFSHLISNFGNYCSYCENTAKLDVEHVVPKKHDQTLELQWTNLLLGCSACNRDFKRSANLNRDGYVWPDEIDTFSCYQYFSSGAMDVAPSLPTEMRTKALATLALCKLNPQPKASTTEPNDFLWHQRALIWTVAELELNKLLNGTSTPETIALLAKAMGFWSVWVSVFIQHEAVIHAISAEFEGTHPDYLSGD